jgi:hypothetical protein
MFIARINYHTGNTAGNDDLAHGYDTNCKWISDNLKDLQKNIWCRFCRPQTEPFHPYYDFIDGTITDTETKRIWPIRNNGTKSGKARLATQKDLEFDEVSNDR